MNILRWLNPIIYWNRYRRYLDRQILFPRIKELANGDRKAIAKVMSMHIGNDPAWQVPAWQLTEADVEILFGMTYWLAYSEDEHKENINEIS